MAWLPGYRGGSLRAAAYRIAWHAALRFRREAWRRRRERMRTTMALRIAASIASPGSRLASSPQDGLARLRAALEPDERTLLILLLDRELSWSEVAEVLSAEGDPVDSAAARKRFERVEGEARAARPRRGAHLGRLDRGAPSGARAGTSHPPASCALPLETERLR